MSSSVPRVIKKSDPTQLIIDWDDGHRTVYTAAELRRICPCANCVQEMTGVRLVDPTSVPDDLSQRDARLVGNYALVVQFSDGHQTGIYSFPYLRDNDPRPA